MRFDQSVQDSQLFVHYRDSPFERVPLLTDAAGEFKATYDVTGSCLHLIRPDAHIGYRSDRIDAERLETFCARYSPTRERGYAPPFGLIM